MRTPALLLQSPIQIRLPMTAITDQDRPTPCSEDVSGISWRDVVGWEGLYQVSSSGQVRSLNRTYATNNQWGSFTRTLKGRLLKPQLHPCGYLSVRLVSRHKSCTYLIHRLVATAFLGIPDKGLEVCHNDGNKQNNNVANLRWDTRLNNSKDRLKHGTVLTGTKNPAAKLTALQVELIKNSSAPQSVIAKQFGICQQNVSCIKRGVTWAKMQEAGQ